VGEAPQGEHPLDPHLFLHDFLKREFFFNQPFEEQMHFWGAFAAGVKAMNAATKKRAPEHCLMISPVLKKISL
jgi:hypothetical protein